MRVAVERWAPEYGSPAELGPVEPSTAEIDAGVERPPESWAPIPASGETASCVRFIDGVRRVDARLWLTGDDGTVHPGAAGSYAAGITRCDSAATVERAEVRRVVLSASPDLTALHTRHGGYAPRPVAAASPDELLAALQARMRALEADVVTGAPPSDLLVVDGPLRDDALPPNAVGYVKTHQRTYLPPALLQVVGELGEGERTPLFATGGQHSRTSSYLRLPLGRRLAHAWEGVVRLEVARGLDTADALTLVDRAASTIPRFASRPHADPRAPQNLTPVAELERVLRRRLGDPALCFRALALATAA